MAFWADGVPSDDRAGPWPAFLRWAGGACAAKPSTHPKRGRNAESVTEAPSPYGRKTSNAAERLIGLSLLSRGGPILPGLSRPGAAIGDTARVLTITVTVTHCLAEGRRCDQSQSLCVAVCPSILAAKLIEVGVY
jgi:hypothetical protein